jgi:hypothetical protein
MRRSSPHWYIWSVVDEVTQWQREDTGTEVELSCPHYRWNPNTDHAPICHACLEPAFERLIEEGATEDEILAAYTDWPIPDKRWLETLLAQLRAADNASSQVRALRTDEPLTQDVARKLIERYGSARKAAAHSDWTHSHIYRVAKGERGKPSS